MGRSRVNQSRAAERPDIVDRVLLTLDVYMRSFHEKTPTTTEEEVLVNLYLHSVVEEYIIFLEYLYFSSLSKLMEATRS